MSPEQAALDPKPSQVAIFSTTGLRQPEALLIGFADQMPFPG